MRSTWPAERILAVLAAASLEAAGLTLAYLAVTWLFGRGEIHFGIAGFAVPVVIGLLLARRLGHVTWEQYLAAVPAAAVLVGAVGGWLAESSAGAPADPLTLVGSAGAWLLGVGVLRGTAHAELDDEGYTAERILRIGVPALVAFWIVAAMSGMTRDVGYTGTAFGATLTLVSSALLALGLARLTELQVETIDRAARRRWLALLIGVTVLLILVGIPLAAVLRVPLSTALGGATGPLAPFIIVLFTLLAAPILLLASSLIDLIGPIDLHVDLPPLSTRGTGGEPVPGDLLTILVLVFIAIAVFDLVVIVVVITAALRRRRKKRRGEPGEEVRELELALGPILRLPRLRLRRPWGRTPDNAVEAYQLTLAALAGRDEGRRSGETPREHATRISDREIGASVARLAADYQLAALGGRRLTAAEERRARGRWRAVTRRVRSWRRLPDTQ